MRKLTVSATQMACSWDLDENIQKAEELIQLAAEDGAQIILLQELFQTPYFCLEQKSTHYALARPLEISFAKGQRKIPGRSMMFRSLKRLNRKGSTAAGLSGPPRLNSTTAMRRLLLI